MSAEDYIDRPVISIRDTARRLSISTSTVRRLLKRGELERVRIGRSVRILNCSIASLVARRGADLEA
jgi:excisionase family DNA binding protein